MYNMIKIINDNIYQIFKSSITIMLFVNVLKILSSPMMTPFLNPLIPIVSEITHDYIMDMFDAVVDVITFPFMFVYTMFDYGMSESNQLDCLNNDIKILKSKLDESIRIIHGMESDLIVKNEEIMNMRIHNEELSMAIKEMRLSTTIEYSDKILKANQEAGHWRGMYEGYVNSNGQQMYTHWIGHGISLSYQFYKYFNPPKYGGFTDADRGTITNILNMMSKVIASSSRPATTNMTRPTGRPTYPNTGT